MARDVTAVGADMQQVGIDRFLQHTGLMSQWHRMLLVESLSQGRMMWWSNYL